MPLIGSGHLACHTEGDEAQWAREGALEAVAPEIYICWFIVIEGSPYILIRATRGARRTKMVVKGGREEKRSAVQRGDGGIDYREQQHKI